MGGSWVDVSVGGLWLGGYVNGCVVGGWWLCGCVNGCVGWWLDGYINGCVFGCVVFGLMCGWRVVVG